MRVEPQIFYSTIRNLSLRLFSVWILKKKIRNFTIELIRIHKMSDIRLKIVARVEFGTSVKVHWLLLLFFLLGSELKYLNE